VEYDGYANISAALPLLAMSFRPVALPQDVPGTLWLTAMPGRLEPWPTFVAEARRAKLTQLVCLTPREELAELSPAYHAAVAQGSLAWRWLNLPMGDFGLPYDKPAFRRGIAQIAAGLRHGDVVLMHCAAGLGRTGTAAACVLKALGLNAPDALQRIRDAGSNPQNALQSGLVEWF
jgi:protein-tyrosine phosphatase